MACSPLAPGFATPGADQSGWYPGPPHAFRRLPSVSNSRMAGAGLQQSVRRRIGDRAGLVRCDVSRPAHDPDVILAVGHHDRHALDEPLVWQRHLRPRRDRPCKRERAPHLPGRPARTTPRTMAAAVSPFFQIDIRSPPERPLDVARGGPMVAPVLALRQTDSTSGEPARSSRDASPRAGRPRRRSSPPWSFRPGRERRLQRSGSR